MQGLFYEEYKTFIPSIEVAKCVQVSSADTIHVGIVMPPPHGATKFCCRLLGVNTPELRAQHVDERVLAKEAREVLRSKVLHKTVHVRVVGYDKYGRLLSRISTDDCADLSIFLVNESMAIQHNGGKKKKVNWTEVLRKHTLLRASRTTPDVLDEKK
jgi:endonuclease YncB( thermonuclease family)